MTAGQDDIRGEISDNLVDALWEAEQEIRRRRMLAISARVGRMLSNKFGGCIAGSSTRAVLIEANHGNV